MRELTSALAYELSKELLNKREREELEAVTSSLMGLDAAAIIKLERELVGKFQVNDKYATYELFKFTSPLKFSELSIKAKSFKDNSSFISSPSRTSVSVIRTELTSELIQFAFVKHKLIEVNNDRTNEDGTIEKIKVTSEAVLVFEANYIKEDDDEILLLLKFPRFRQEPHRLYGFVEEVQFFSSWNADFSSKGVSPVDLKAFFESLDDKAFDKYGFEVSDVKNDKSGKTVGSNFQIQFPFNSDTLTTQMYKNIDKVIMPEFIQSFSTEFTDYLLAKKRTDSEQAIEDFSGFFETNGISEEFFSLLHQACTYGIGHVRFIKDGKQLYRYNLEYKLSKYGLIRVSHIGGGAFDPIFEKIKIFLKGK